MAPLINFSGLASGIDSNALIKAMLAQQRKSQITPLKDRVSALTATNDSLDRLTELLKTVKSAADKFRVISGGAISKSSTSSNEAVATASVTNAAQSGTYTLTVAQTASSGTLSYADRYATSSSVINASINNGASAADRTVSIAVGQGASQETVDIELTNTTTVGDFMTQFNAQSDNAEASLVNVGTSSSPSYAVVINTTNSGLERGEITFSTGTEVETAGSGAFIAASATISQARNSQFTLSGIGGTIERSTNSVSDVLAGVTFNLQSNGATTLSITPSSSGTKSVISDFVESYNDLVQYISENDLVTQDLSSTEPNNIFGPLAASSIDESVLSQIRGVFASVQSGSGSVTSLASLGIKTERDGTIAFDEDTFEDAFASDPTGVGLVTENLGEELAATQGLIAQFVQFNGLIDVAQNTNQREIDRNNDRISVLEAGLSRQESSLTSQFARLESLIGRLTQQQNSLTSLLPR